MTGRPPSARDLADPVLALALGLGSGLVPRAPGTAGTLVGVALYLALAALAPFAYVLVVAAIVIAGVPLCRAAAVRLGSHDHPAIVWDEISGYLIAMLGLPAEPAWLIGAFALFRLLDGVKPWPIRALDRRVGGGLGVMLDDAVAGAITCGLLHAARLLVTA